MNYCLLTNTYVLCAVQLARSFEPIPYDSTFRKLYGRIEKRKRPISPRRSNSLDTHGHLHTRTLTHTCICFITISSAAIIPLNDNPKKPAHKKVSIIGCGQVGMAIAYSILNQESAGTIALVDRNSEKLIGEAKDLEQGSAFHGNVRVLASDRYDVTAHSNLVIITAGVAQSPGESRLNLVERNVSVMQKIIPPVLAQSPDASICIVSNPCDIMTAVASKIAGPAVPPGRIFGSGTCLDSSRLQSLLAKTLDIDAQSVEGYVVGEHGDHSVAVWSSVRVGGIPMLQIGKEPTDVHKNMHREVVESAYDVIVRKGYTNWAVGLTGAYIAKGK